MKADYWRQLDFFDPAKFREEPVIIGAGSTGSFIAVGLAALGVKSMTIIDFDTVDAHNLPNQFFSQNLLEDTGEAEILKVVALKNTIGMLYPEVKINIIPQAIEEVDAIQWANAKIIFSCVDRMDARTYIFNTCREHRGILIDPRTGGEVYNVYSIIRQDYNQGVYYTESLFGESAQLPCTGTAIVDVAFQVAATCIQRMRYWIRNNHTNYLIHTFHDCTTGLISYMKVENNSKQAGTFVRTEQNIKNITGEHVEEITDADSQNPNQE